MWTRKLLKDNARIVLQRRFSTLLLAVIIEKLITGITAELSGRTLLFRLSDTLFHSSSGWHLTGLLAIVVFCLTVITQLFIAPLLEVGKNRFMTESRQGDAPLATLSRVHSGLQRRYLYLSCHRLRTRRGDEPVWRPTDGQRRCRLPGDPDPLLYRRYCGGLCAGCFTKMTDA